MPTPLAPQPKRALVVGASSGIGAACAAELVKRGYRVALVARRGDLLDQLAAKLNQKAGMEAALPFPHDVTAYDEIPALFDHIAAALGGLSVIIYAAGVMYPIGREEYDFGKDRAMVEVNLLGAVAWLNQAADLFRRIGGGTIIGISSIAGERGRKP
ncbi:MAG TPA: SDR family NAD(P)-dependent oxidoreductase, partial [bacterium]|nr:SDR family NAD(P)-dependent oxidoreductase [bacterium]